MAEPERYTAKWHAWNWKRYTEQRDAAVTAGTHSTTTQRLCNVCGQWVDVLYHVTIDRKYACVACADRMGEGPRAFEAKKNKRFVAGLMMIHGARNADDQRSGVRGIPAAAEPMVAPAESVDQLASVT